MIKMTQIQKEKSPFLLRIINRPICKCSTKPSLSPPRVPRHGFQGVHTDKGFSSITDTDFVEDAEPQLFYLIIAAKSWIIGFLKSIKVENDAVKL